MRRRSGSVLMLVLFALCGAARAQDDAGRTPHDESVEINLDALNEPTTPVVPEIKTLPPETPVVPKPKPDVASLTSVKMVPLPRYKPIVGTPASSVAEVKTDSATPASAKPGSKAPVIVGKAPAKPEVPVNIVENFPVEISGVAADPFAGKKTNDPIAGFSVISRVRFAKDDSQLPETAIGILDALALKLATTKERVRLAAFSGQNGDLSSQARRLSLERARAVRDYLVSKGVPFDRMDVLPFGAAKDGINDRVDVMAVGS